HPDLHAFARRRLHLHEIESRRTVSAHADHLARRAAELRTNSRRNSGAEHAQLENVQKRSRLGRWQKPERPQRSVAAVGDKDTVSAEDLADCLHRVRRMDSGSLPFSHRRESLLTIFLRGLSIARQILTAPGLRATGLEHPHQALERALRVRD